MIPRLPVWHSWRHWSWLFFFIVMIIHTISLDKNYILEMKNAGFGTKLCLYLDYTTHFLGQLIILCLFPPL